MSVSSVVLRAFWLSVWLRDECRLVSVAIAFKPRKFTVANASGVDRPFVARPRMLVAFLIECAQVCLDKLTELFRL